MLKPVRSERSIRRDCDHLSQHIFSLENFIGPYDVIHVGAAAPILPDALVDQLSRPGRMFIPIGEDSQAVWQIDKDENGNVTKKHLFGVMVMVSILGREPAANLAHLLQHSYSMCLSLIAPDMCAWPANSPLNISLIWRQDLFVLYLGMVECVSRITSNYCIVSTSQPLKGDQCHTARGQRSPTTSTKNVDAIPCLNTFRGRTACT